MESTEALPTQFQDRHSLDWGFKVWESTNGVATVWESTATLPISFHVPWNRLIRLGVYNLEGHSLGVYDQVIAQPRHADPKPCFRAVFLEKTLENQIKLFLFDGVVLR